MKPKVEGCSCTPSDKDPITTVEERAGGKLAYRTWRHAKWLADAHGIGTKWRAGVHPLVGQRAAGCKHCGICVKACGPSTLKPCSKELVCPSMNLRVELRILCNCGLQALASGECGQQRSGVAAEPTEVFYISHRWREHTRCVAGERILKATFANGRVESVVCLQRWARSEAQLKAQERRKGGDVLEGAVGGEPHVRDEHNKSERCNGREGDYHGWVEPQHVVRHNVHPLQSV